MGEVCARGDSAGVRAQHNPNYLEKFAFAFNLYNRANFCKTIKSRGSNPMFQPKLHINCLTKLALLRRLQAKHLSRYLGVCVIVVNTYGSYPLF